MENLTSVVIRGAWKYNKRYTDARDGKAGEFASGLARTPARHAAERSCFLVDCGRRVLGCGERSEPHLYQDFHIFLWTVFLMRSAFDYAAPNFY